MPYLAIIFLSFFLMQCSSSSTQLISHWKDPKLEEAEIKALNNVMVAVFAADEASRRAAEDKIAEINSTFIQSYMVLNETISQDPEKSKKIMQERNFDGVLVFRLMSIDKSQDYVPGTNYSGGYYGYHSGYWGSYYDPGYYIENTSYKVEVNLFSIKRDKLIWSGLTSTLNPISVKSTMTEIAETVQKQLQKDIEFSKTASNE